jgi:hypothetical protein
MVIPASLWKAFSSEHTACRSTLASTRILLRMGNGSAWREIPRPHLNFCCAAHLTRSLLLSHLLISLKNQYLDVHYINLSVRLFLLPFEP